MSRFQPVWREGEPLRLTYLTRGELHALRLQIGDQHFAASIGADSAEIIVPASLYSSVANGSRVALQVLTPAGWESVANGFLVKEV